MDMKKRSTRLGAALVLFAVILRLGGGLTTASAHSLRQWDGELAGFCRWGAGGVSARTVTVPQPTQPVQAGITFRREDLDKIRMRYITGSSYRPDLEALLLSRLFWDLDDGMPAVLILHSHGSEAFQKQPGQDYQELVNTRTHNTDYNMIAVGEYLAGLLEEAGIRVIHDRTMHDVPSYNDAYTQARASVKDYLEQYPEIRLVLDLHRDSATNADGSLYATGVTVDGETIGQLMLVMGTDGSGQAHPRWEENLSVALKLLAVLERQVPGITRTTSLRASRYNQDLHPAMLLVEVGSSGNTLAQAKAAAKRLADAIIAVKNGANLDT
jgi:stage II sporulation protein P